VQQKLITGHPDLIVMTDSSGGLATGATTREASVRAWTRGFHTWLTPVVRAGIPVHVLRDTPWPLSSYQEPVPDCVAAHLDDWRPCGGPRSTWIREDPNVDALAGLPHTGVINLTDRLCGATTCPAVIGGVLVYADQNHMTATFAATLAPYLAGPLQRALTAG
jgi:hypothetical protein